MRYIMTYQDYLAHHGIKNQKWGKTNGPPYPLTDSQRSAAENSANQTSKSAKILAKAGPNNRFARSDLKSNSELKKQNRSAAMEGTGASKVRTHKGTTTRAVNKPSKFGDDYDGTTYEEIMEDRLSRFASKYGYDPTKIGQRTADEEETKSQSKSKSSGSGSKSTSTKKSDEEKAAEKERKRIQDAEDKAMRVIDRIFNGSTSERSLNALLDELNEGWLNGINFDAEDFKALAKDPKYKELMEKLGTESKGADYYAKVLTQLGDSDDPKVKALREKYEKLIEERAEEDAEQGYEELETLKKRMGADYKDKSLDRFSRSISAMTDFVEFMKDANPTEMNRARYRVMSYLEDKLSWFNENGTNAGDRTASLKEKRNMQKVTEWLRKHGF